MLLLNTALTVIEGRPGIHLKAWTPFTDAVIKAVALRASPVVFMLWGRPDGPHLTCHGLVILCYTSSPKRHLR